MRKGIHPETYDILTVFTNGEERVMKSTLGKKDEMIRIHLESDCFNHPAWNPSLRATSKKNSKAAKFLSKFGDLDL
ncbi:50S ribosomal protein L31 [Ehrlichia ruminantium]|uniref:Large ribosomal subunit protein bL31 n=1 Tax=Ehrlichia ruminantium (strain Welgevonden) TaxID=254945 RepID=A0A0H3M0M1_EHRRW|nr:50S ribosomal protein L31 [Ehrlichia ruminantium]KYW92805.1 50S ribosomal protein L31 [Ehrlichia ruminantium]QLK50833.1 50S ribosomal protein L31 [Ehrlichia ruminantium]QLK51755.1 50S ribosomal protein L31 [Ehrlichia ruminantium]QLK52676.1 50S ribosomal protein L31 [Ehrlichia ruminantium]QLK53593.1 50S ribosomal protein L31 [Ehrlichia ruminantium]